MNFRPLRDQLLIEPQDKPQQTSGGIWLPDTYDEEVEVGVVCAVGPGNRTKRGLEPLVSREGNRVAYGTMSKRDIELDGKTYHVIQESSIIGILTE